jgi:hypothetical protein
MSSRELTEKVLEWCRCTYPRLTFARERIFQLTPRVVGIRKPYFRVDIVGVNKEDKEVLGIEIKTLRDHDSFRKTATAIGQSMILRAAFGRAIMIFEVDQTFRDYKLGRYQWLTNINSEYGIGVALVQNSVALIDPPKRGRAPARSLFVRYGPEGTKRERRSFLLRGCGEESRA